MNKWREERALKKRGEAALQEWRLSIARFSTTMAEATAEVMKAVADLVETRREFERVVKEANEDGR